MLKIKLSLNENPCDKAKGEFFYFSIMKLILAKFLNSLEFFCYFFVSRQKSKIQLKKRKLIKIRFHLFAYILFPFQIVERKGTINETIIQRGKKISAYLNESRIFEK